MKVHSLNLDGSTGEGGGQILRTGLALSMVTGRPLHITRIRAGRPKPGLMRQHLACVQAAVAVCGGRAEGAELNSQTLLFTPGEVRSGDYRFQIATAGSCLLVLQTVLPALMLAEAPSKVELMGGTHNPMAPPFDFLERAFAPLVRRLGVGLELDLKRRGFFPAGGGELVAHIAPDPQALAPVDVLERGPLLDAWGEALVPGLARSIAPRELETLGQRMGWTFEAGQLRQPPTRQNEGPGNALLATLEHAHVTEVFASWANAACRPSKWPSAWRMKSVPTNAATARWARTWPTNGCCPLRWPCGAVAGPPATPAPRSRCTQPPMRRPLHWVCPCRCGSSRWNGRCG